MPRAARNGQSTASAQESLMSRMVATAAGSGLRPASLAHATAAGAALEPGGPAVA